MKSLLRSILTGDLDSWLEHQGEPRFRAKQIIRWVARATGDFVSMSDLSASLREKLAAEFHLRTSQIDRRLHDPDGTEKLLLRWEDGTRIEGVLLREEQRRTICISTQVGCAMGCVFCASGLSGLERNLQREEILEQTLRLVERLGPDERLSHVVVMGMGEPLANLTELLPVLDFLSSPQGLGISARRITISTVGIPEAIRRLARHNRPYRLAISLHCAEDSQRSQLIPVNESIGVAAIMEAAGDFFRATGRRLTFEYTMLAGVNDSPADARRLAELLHGRTALVNVIPYNPVPDLPYETPAASRVRAFRELLEQAGVEVQVRKRKGDRIEAACGQLRRAEGKLRQAEDKPRQGEHETLSGASGVE